MSLTIRRKILLAFGVLPVVLAVSGFWMLKGVDRLGRSIDVIMRENYRSVICCQKVNEALERIDSGLLYSFSDKMPSDRDFAEQIAIVNREWTAELANLTVKSEKEKAERVKEDLALAVDAKSGDEIGQLSRSFNAMANSLRTTREDLQARLVRGERAFRELPLPIAVFDVATGVVRLSSSTAAQGFGWAEGRALDDFKESWLQRLFAEVRRTGRACSDGEFVDRTVGGRRCYFCPTAIPLPVGVPAGPAGARGGRGAEGRDAARRHGGSPDPRRHRPERHPQDGHQGALRPSPEDGA